MLGDPFIPFRLSASEPVPVEAGPVFRSASGDVVTPKASPNDTFAFDFSPPVVLPFDQRYTVDITYVPPESSPPSFAVTTFALRLPITAGATALRFSYRTLSRGTTPGSAATYLVGSVGSPLVTTMLPPNMGTTTPVSIGGEEMTLGPLMTMRINLPDPGAPEVMLARTIQPPACDPTLGPPDGILIDDLRTE
jgi:hypothetical protein